MMNLEARGEDTLSLSLPHTHIYSIYTCTCATPTSFPTHPPLQILPYTPSLYTLPYTPFPTYPSLHTLLYTSSPADPPLHTLPYTPFLYTLPYIPFLYTTLINPIVPYIYTYIHTCISIPTPSITLPIYSHPSSFHTTQSSLIPSPFPHLHLPHPSHPGSPLFITLHTLTLHTAD